MFGSTFAIWIDENVHSVVIAWLLTMVGFARECETVVLGVANVPQQQNNSFSILLVVKITQATVVFLCYSEASLICANGTAFAGCRVRAE